MSRELRTLTRPGRPAGDQISAGVRITKRLSALLCATALTLGLGAVAHASGPAEHFEFPVVGDVFNCGAKTYTITEGTIRATFHEGSSQSGNQNFTGTLKPTGIVAEGSDGSLVSIRGSVWFGGTSNAKQGTEQATFTGKLQFIEQGSGTVDNVNQTFHITTVNGNLKELDFGSCQLPE